ncbi:hypothetical protein RHMOL_Rhmol10G0050400 [Rhododendron molle]|uniref:Uncharacterized protein n=1 Tax=Rhododendron molle TaxID=49168 RepID=A0ACC0M083_RHOML|nr:hypothetical protein RHMOL_Rhmol10G0050400 [Rhododendron molle]
MWRIMTTVRLCFRMLGKVPLNLLIWLGGYLPLHLARLPLASLPEIVVEKLFGGRLAELRGIQRLLLSRGHYV